MNTETLQNAYDEDSIGHPLLMEPDLHIPPSIGLIRQLSGANGGIQNNLIFGDLGIAKGFLSHAPNLKKIFQEWIIKVDTDGVMTDADVNNGFESIRNFLTNNRFDLLYMIEQDMSKTAVRHVLWYLTETMDGNHNRLYSLLKDYSPTRFGYEYGYEFGLT